MPKAKKPTTSTKKPRSEIIENPSLTEAEMAYIRDHYEVYLKIDKLAQRLAEQEHTQAASFPVLKIDTRLEHLRFLRAGVNLAVDVDTMNEVVSMKRSHELPELLRFVLLVKSTERVHLLAASKPSPFLGETLEDDKTVLYDELDAFMESNAGERTRSFEEDYLLTLALVNATGLATPYDQELYTWVMRQALREAKIKVRL